VQCREKKVPLQDEAEKKKEKCFCDVKCREKKEIRKCPCKMKQREKKNSAFVM
jgi:hypothetical protein